MSKALQQAQQIWEKFMAIDQAAGQISCGQGAHGGIEVHYVDRELLGALATMADAEPKVHVTKLQGEWVAFDHVVFDGTSVTMTLQAESRRATLAEIEAATEAGRRYGAEGVVLNVQAGSLCPA